MKTAVRITEITKIEGLDVLKPIKVQIFLENEIYYARALDIPFSRDWEGKTEEEAVENLKDRIIGTYGDLCTPIAGDYALDVASALLAHVELTESGVIIE